jgi:hypothetical protein
MPTACHSTALGRRLGRRTQGRRKPNQGTLKECYRRTRRFTAASDDSWRNTAERCAWPRLDGGSVTQLSHSFRVPVGLGVLPRVRRPRRRLWALEFHAVGMFRGTPHALCAGAMQRFSHAGAGFQWERRLLMVGRPFQGSEVMGTVYQGLCSSLTRLTSPLAKYGRPIRG